MSTESKDHRSKPQLLAENEELRRQLEEAQQTLEAIQSGAVDALVVAGSQGEQIYSLTGAEHTYRVIVETMNEAALTADPDGTILFCNQRFCDLMKVPMNEVLGHNVTTFVARPQRAPLDAILAGAQTGPVQRRITLRAADGAEVPVQLSASPLAADGTTSICLVASDLTELEASANSIRVLREHQQALEESEARFRSIFEASQDAIVITNDEGVYVQANPATEAVFGLPAEQIIGRRVSQFVREDVDFKVLWRDFLARGTFQGELPLVGADGQMRFVETYAVANILPGRHLAIVRDVTERRQARIALEQANESLQIQAAELENQSAELQLQAAELLDANENLRESETRFHRLFDEDLTGDFVCTPDGRILLCNPAFARIFGFASPDEAVGTSFFDLYANPRDHEFVLRAVGDDGSIDRHEVWMKRRDGHRMYIVENLVGGRDDEGRIDELKGYLFDDTERKQAEESLRMSEEKFRTLHALSPVAIVLNRLDNGQFLESNQALWDMTGYTEEEFRLLTYWDITPIEYQEMEAKQLELLRTAGRYGPYEKEYIRKDGSRFPVLLVGVRITDPNGTDLIYSVIQDITELKTRAQALRESEERFRALVTASSQVVYRMSADWSEMYQLQSQSFLANTERPNRAWLQEYIPPDEQPRVIAAIHEAIQTKSIFQLEHWVRRADGSLGWTSSRAVPLMDAKGEIVEWFGFAIDTTEGKQAEDALRESEARLQAVLSVLPVGVFIADGDGRLVSVNPAAETIWGGRAPLSQRPDDYREYKGRWPDTGRELEPHEWGLARAVRSGEVSGPEEVEIECFDGERKTILNYAIPIRSDGNGIGGAVAVTVDITGRKRMERELRELNTTLERRVSQRTEQLQHRARQLQKLALELSEAEDRERRRLAEVLHDDLQQILAAAKFHLNLLRHRARNDPSQQTVAVQVDKMLGDAIEKSRSLSHELSPAVLHHGDFGETMRWLAHQIQMKHGLVVHVDTFSEVRIESDALKTFLYKSAQELLFNVVKHARTDEARVRVRRLGRCIALSVSDRGRGFDPHELRGAAGFGLFSIRERIELLGGRMRIKSAKGRGSTFHIVVPDGLTGPAAVSELRFRDSNMAEAGDGQTQDTGPRLRVLVADDHQIVREGLVSLLNEQPGIEVVDEAANGREAVNLTSRLRPDVVIMDVAMPLINGDEATRQIKTHLPETRIIALSMYDEPDLIERMHRAGAEAFVLKTAPSEELLAAVRGRSAERVS